MKEVRDISQNSRGFATVAVAVLFVLVAIGGVFLLLVKSGGLNLGQTDEAFSPPIKTTISPTGGIKLPTEAPTPADSLDRDLSSLDKDLSSLDGEISGADSGLNDKMLNQSF